MPAMSLEHEVVRAVLVSAPQLTGRARTLLQAGASTSVLSRHSHPTGARQRCSHGWPRRQHPRKIDDCWEDTPSMGERPLFVYSRDAPAGPLLKLKKMVSAEHQGFRETERQPHSFTSHTSDGLPSAG